MHEYRVSLVIMGENLDTDVITSELNLTPSQVFPLEPESKDLRRRLRASWTYDGVEPGEDAIYWRSVEEGLIFLLEPLLSVKEKLVEYGKRYEVTLWCSHFHKGYDGGPIFSPEILKKISELGVQLFIDTYCCEINGDGEPA